MPKSLKALIFDLDGTAVPRRADGMPSPRVIEAVQKAKQKVLVTFATGRFMHDLDGVWSSLQISEPVIINGGTQIYDPVKKKAIWEQSIPDQTVQAMLSEVKGYDYMMADEKTPKRVPIKEYQPVSSISMPYIYGAKPADAKKMEQKLKKIKGLNIHLVGSWKENMVDVHMMDELASKQHALRAFLALRNIHPDTVMTVGDDTNDVPMFKLSGWAVAMGNAPEAVKQQADWVAPSVDEDGLAVAIEKFILSQ